MLLMCGTSSSTFSKMLFGRGQVARCHTRRSHGGARLGLDCAQALWSTFPHSLAATEDFVHVVDEDDESWDSDEVPMVSGVSNDCQIDGVIAGFGMLATAMEAMQPEVFVHTNVTVSTPRSSLGFGRSLGSWLVQSVARRIGDDWANFRKKWEYNAPLSLFFPVVCASSRWIGSTCSHGQGEESSPGWEPRS